MKIYIFKRYVLFSFIFLTVFILSSCGASKRSDCPTYIQSDPKIIFGEITFEERMEREEKRLKIKSGKERRKEAKKQIESSKKTRKKK